ncbi:VCBS repeat-containing protein [candidate division KSB1 bacterium]|nr:VCBS repeat-containing protein [candidate division KSB1 bacterium]
MRVYSKNSYLMIRKLYFLLLISFFLGQPTIGAAPKLLFKPHILPGRARPSPPMPKPDYQAQRIINVLAIRVEFAEDTLETTTGNGTFNSRFPDDLQIDPIPHDKKYFEDHLLFLKNYFERVSNGQLNIQYQVFPSSTDSSYRLFHPMWHYNYNAGEEVLNRQLAELFRDAVTMADTVSPEIVFSNYQGIIIFHAGVGQDFGEDDTPFDIPSVYLDSLDFQVLGPEYSNGIPVDEGTFSVKRGIILPECEHQPYRDLSGETQWIEFGLNGVMCLMFGHQLGLPNLYNSDTGASGIGRWGLMDQGSGALDGLVPVEPCAWSKVFMGWVSPIEISAFDTTILTIKRGEIYKIPINSQEYFLLENRSNEVFPRVSIDSLRYQLYQDSSKWYSYFDLLQIHLGALVKVDSTSGVLTSVERFDWGIPGSGILIWHVDESVIHSKLGENRVNADPEGRGVDLEEADGSEDIGQEYGLFSPGGGTEYGNPYDVFFKDNPAFLNANPNLSKVEFSPRSVPDSRSNSGASSHLIISDFSTIDTVMSFKVTNDFYQEGFPLFIGPTFTNSPKFGDLDGDGLNEIIISSVGGRLTVVKDNSSYGLDLPDSVHSTPALADLNEDGNLEIIIGCDDGVLYAFDHLLDFLFSYSTGSPIKLSPVVTDFRIAIGNAIGDFYIINYTGEDTLFFAHLEAPIRGIAPFKSDSTFIISLENGKVFFVGDFSGNPIELIDLGEKISGCPAVADFNGDGNFDFVVVGNQGKVGLFDGDGTNANGWVVSSGNSFSSTPAIADINDDGYLDIIISGDNYIFAYNRNGTLVNNFPISVKQSGNVGQIRSSPIIGDINSHGDLEIIVGTPANEVVAFHHNGRMVDGFPLTTGGPVHSTPMLCNIDDDPQLELVVGCDDGYIYAWNLPESDTSAYIPWGQYLHDKRNTSTNLETPSPPDRQGELMPGSLVYNWPNPTEGNSTNIRYYLNYDASVNIKIFDLAGDLIDEFDGQGLGQADNEVPWDLSGVSSGVYLARVEAKGNGKKKIAFIKIAVVK